jgi:hypothetical protein
MSEVHVGVSELRKMNKKVLAAQKEITVIHDHLEPIAVMIPWQMYMAVQKLRAEIQETQP